MFPTILSYVPDIPNLICRTCKGNTPFVERRVRIRE